MTCGIYKIENLINGKVYIGQSIEIEKRWQKHLNAKDNFLIHKALRKYGKENFSFTILEECSLFDLDAKEKFWINQYQSLVPLGYNMVQGGSNGAGLSKGIPVLQYDLNGNFLKEYDSANQASIATKIDHWSICACCRGEYAYSGKYQWRYKGSDLPIKQLNVRTDFTVLQLDIKTNEILAEFSSPTAATKITGVASSTICNVCNGKGKTAGGYKWKYKY